MSRKNTKEEVMKKLATIGIKPTTVPREERSSFSFVAGTPRDVIIRTK